MNEDLKYIIKETLEDYQTAHFVFFKFYIDSDKEIANHVLSYFNIKLKALIPIKIQYKINILSNESHELSLMTIVPSQLYKSLESPIMYNETKLPSFTKLIFNVWEEACSQYNVSENFDTNCIPHLYIKNPLGDEDHLNYLIKIINNNFKNSGKSSTTNYTTNLIDTILTATSKYDDVTLYSIYIKTPFGTNCEEDVLNEFVTKLSKNLPFVCYVYKPVIFKDGEYELTIAASSKLISDFYTPFTIGVKEFKPLNVLVFKSWLSTLADNHFLSESKRETKFVLSSVKYEHLIDADIFEFKGFKYDITALEFRNKYITFNNIISNRRKWKI